MFLLGLAHIYGQIVLSQTTRIALHRSSAEAVEKFLQRTFCRVLAVCCCDVVSNEDIEDSCPLTPAVPHCLFYVCE